MPTICSNLARNEYAIYHYNSMYKTYRVAKKVNHYQESSLSRIKTASEATFFNSFEYKRCTRLLQLY